MNCSKEFIVAYNKMFKFIDQHKGEQHVIEFWELLSDLVCQRLVKMAKEGGISGLARYWIESLSEEGADCEIVYSSRKDVLTIEMMECPAYEKMAEANEVPYENYCGHCQVMYSRALKPLGITFKCTCCKQSQGRCFIEVYRSHG